MLALVIMQGALTMVLHVRRALSAARNAQLMHPDNHAIVPSFPG